MKILYVGNFSLPDHDAAAVRVMGNALALKEGHHEVVFVDAQKIENYQKLQQPHNVNGFKVYSRQIYANKIKDYLKCMFSISHIAEIAKKEKVDAIFAYNYSSIALKKIRCFCKRKKIKCVSDCTEWYIASNYKFPLSIFSAIDTFFRMRIVNKMCDGVITVSSYLDKYYFKQNTIRIPFFMDCCQLELIKPCAEFDLEKINVIYGGSPGKNKEKIQDILYGVKNSSNYNKIVLRIVGLTKAQYLENYPEDAWIEQDDHIQFVGRVPRNENLSLIKASDFLIFYREPTRQNMAGFPTKFVEAVGLGTPVVTTDTSDLRECSAQNNIPTSFVANSEDISSFFSKEMEDLKNIKSRAMACRKTFDYIEKSESFCNWTMKLGEKK